MKKRVYISGPMTGIVPDDAAKNREEYMARFHRAELLLINAGYWVVNPCRLAPCRSQRLYRWMVRMFGQDGAYMLALLYDLWQLHKCDLIYKIPGWKESRGANVESCFAFHYDVWVLPTKTREKIDRKMSNYIIRREEALRQAKGTEEPSEEHSRHPKRMWAVSIKGRRTELFESMPDAMAYGDSTGESYDIVSVVSPE